jgi:hypothetical protein
MTTLQDVTAAIIAGLSEGLSVQPDAATLERLDRIERLIQDLQATINGTVSTHIKGDKAAARFVGYKDDEAFRRWAKRNGIKPIRRGSRNLWERRHLIKGRE